MIKRILPCLSLCAILLLSSCKDKPFQEYLKVFREYRIGSEQAIVETARIRLHYCGEFQKNKNNPAYFGCMNVQFKLEEKAKQVYASQLSR